MPLQIIRQDITQMDVDAIVNPTNPELIAGGGVDLAIRIAGGPALDEACRRIAPLAAGSAVITPGYNLPAKYVIHTVGPIWQDGLHGERDLLRSAYLESLKLADASSCETVAFPLISSGTYGYPKDRVLAEAVETVSSFLQDHDMTVYLCVYDKTSYQFSRALYDDIKTYIGDDDAEQFETDNCISHLCAELTYNKSSSSSKKSKLNTDPLASFLHSDQSFQRKYASFVPAAGVSSALPADFVNLIRATDKSFAQKLLDHIDARKLTDAYVYKKANVDRKVFSKIRSNIQTYRPSKQTAVAFAIALELNLEQTQDLLGAAGLTLSDSFIFDKIIRYFIQNEVYDINVINQALFEFDQVCLG